ncbi:MAG: HIT family protein [Spirochaetales bacterium]|nr:HIT family protein [Spirochaetota bacterium]NLL24415.1 HIT family protein [Spirochaetales bacterium]HOE89936.1 HIT family protein [Sphaerochaeta sp.]HOR79965.1 HIT family protein [Sphaerochaeta sp.]HRV23646.1 HIT family protein [Sphaerochaeta sp.]
METVFTKIRAGAIPSAKVYEDEICFVILDINPVNKGHLLIITNEVHPTLADTPDEVLSHLLVIAKKADAKLREVLGCAATNVVINNGEASGQEIPHLHLHIIPRYADDGKRLTFPKAHYDEGEIAALGKRLEFE